MQFQLILLKCMQKFPFYHHETCNETKQFFQQKHEITPSLALYQIVLATSSVYQKHTR